MIRSHKGKVARFPKPKYGIFFGPGNRSTTATNVVLVVVVVVIRFAMC